MNPLLLLGGALAAAYLVMKPKGAPAGGAVFPGQAGADLASLGERVLSDIASKGQAYDKELLKSFQAMSGIAVDGLYGPESAAALARATGKSPPPPIFSSGPAPSEPPSRAPMTPTDQTESKRLAEQVFSDLNANGRNYDRDLMKAFQRSVHALYVDGLYGPATAGALQYFTDRKPPDPIYAGANGSKTIVPYKPPV